MFEALLAWIFLFVGILNLNEPLWFLVSGVFAVACQISRVVDRMK